MAKGLRARSNKVNKQNLRSKVFRHVEEERKQRLSAKLLDLASNPPEKGMSASEKSNNEGTHAPCASPRSGLLILSDPKGKNSGIMATDSSLVDNPEDGIALLYLFLDAI